MVSAEILLQEASKRESLTACQAYRIKNLPFENPPFST